MSNYSHKLAELKTKKANVLAAENKLIHKRKMEIANLIERCELLTLSDELFAGLFLELKTCIKDKDNRMQEWEVVGGRFLKPTKTKPINNAATQTITNTESQIN